MPAYSLIERYARRVKGRKFSVVLPEGHDERVVSAAVRLRDEDIAVPILLGDPHQIRKATPPGTELRGILTIDPKTSGEIDRYTGLYRRGRQDMPEAVARRIVTKRPFYGGMMVASGDAHAMVGGAATATATMILAGTLTVGLLDGVNTPSSCFLMIIPDFQGQKNKLFVYADCAVNVDPTPEQLADIALASASSAAALLSEPPEVAMLSYSSKGSGAGPAVEKVRKALEIARRRAPNLDIDGEFQADTAIISRVAARKIAGSSKVAGKANVLIFPDLNSGNIAYKLTQYMADAQAIGPLLQGFAKPIADLSRGASIEDIVLTTILTLAQLTGPDDQKDDSK